MSYSMLMRLDKALLTPKIPKIKRSRDENKSGNDKKKSKPDPSTKEDVVDYDVPDKRFGDLYCVVCDSHMNSQRMWESHIQGKRHLKNKKNGPTDAKYDNLDDEPIAKQKLEQVQDIIVGLDFICETHRIDGDPIYQCYICSATIPNCNQLIVHLLTVKHRMAFLKEKDPDGYEEILKLGLGKGNIEPIVADCCADYVHKHGQGKIIVKKEILRPDPKVVDKKINPFEKMVKSDPVCSRYETPSIPKVQQKSRISNMHNENSSEFNFGKQQSKTDPYYKHSSDDYYEDRKRYLHPCDTYEKTKSSSYSSSPSSSKRDHVSSSHKELHTRSSKQTSKSKIKELQMVLNKKNEGDSPPTRVSGTEQNASKSLSKSDIFSAIDKMDSLSFLKIAIFKMETAKFQTHEEIEYIKKLIAKGVQISSEHEMKNHIQNQKNITLLNPSLCNQPVIPQPLPKPKSVPPPVHPIWDNVCKQKPFLSNSNGIPGLSGHANNSASSTSSQNLPTHQKTQIFLKSLQSLLDGSK